ncbi:unnamed protein product, partial [Meganyctiphanes norvegica]
MQRWLAGEPHLLRPPQCLILVPLILLLLVVSQAKAYPQTDADDVAGILDVIPGSANVPDDSPPLFDAHPKDSYVIKNKPAILTCRAQHALKVYFKCNGGTPPHEAATETAFVEPSTGMRVVEAQLHVERATVEEYFEDYECHCVAWSSRGQTTSSTARISTA